MLVFTILQFRGKTWRRLGSWHSGLYGLGTLDLTRSRRLYRVGPGFQTIDLEVELGAMDMNLLISAPYHSTKCSYFYRIGNKYTILGSGGFQSSPCPVCFFLHPSFGKPQTLQSYILSSCCCSLQSCVVAAPWLQFLQSYQSPGNLMHAL